MHQTSPETRDKMIEQYTFGLSCNQIARRIGFSYGTVRKFVRRAGILRSNAEGLALIYKQGILKGSRLPQSEKEKIRTLYNSGLSSRQVAKEIHYSYNTIRRVLAESGGLRDRCAALELAQQQGRITPHCGENNPNFKGYRYESYGYIYIRSIGHPRAQNNGYVREHILVWEAANRPLPKVWVIHHLNGIKNDNRLENLVALPKKNHHGWLVQQEIQKRVRELESENSKLHQLLAYRGQEVSNVVQDR